MEILNNTFYSFWYAFGDYYALFWACFVLIAVLAMFVYFFLKR